jgi:NTE family protein
VMEAVGSSMCLPALFPPYPLEGRLLIDGGVLNNLPVEQMAAPGEGPVIAVDVTARFNPLSTGPRATPRTRRSRVLARMYAIVTGRDFPLPSFKETLMRSVVLGSTDTDAAAKQYADLVIVPDTGGTPLTAWKEIERMRSAGRRAAEQALATAPSTLFPC